MRGGNPDADFLLRGQILYRKGVVQDEMARVLAQSGNSDGKKYREYKNFAEHNGVLSDAEGSIPGALRIYVSREIVRIDGSRTERIVEAIRFPESYFSLATTKSGAQSKARLISEFRKVQIDLRADSAYFAAQAVAASSDP